MNGYTATSSPRFEPGQIVYLRAKVIGNDFTHGWAVQLVDKLGRPSDNGVRYVTEKQIITAAEAVRAVTGG